MNYFPVQWKGHHTAEATLERDTTLWQFEDEEKIIWLPTRRGRRLLVVWVVCYNHDMVVMVAAGGML
jgi:hypothetical protein